MNKNILIYGIGAAILYFLTKKKNNEKGVPIVDKNFSQKFSDDKILTKKKNNEKGVPIVDEKGVPIVDKNFSQKFSDDKILKMTKEAEVFYDDDNSTGINNFTVKL